MTCPSCDAPVPDQLVTCGRCGAAIPAAQPARESFWGPVPTTAGLPTAGPAPATIPAPGTIPVGGGGDHFWDAVAPPPPPSIAAGRPASFQPEVAQLPRHADPGRRAWDPSRAPRISKSWTPGVGFAIAIQIFLAGLWLLEGFSSYDSYWHELIDGNADQRAFAALDLEIHLPFLAIGVGLLLLVVGLMRGLRVAQYLTCWANLLFPLVTLLTLSSAQSVVSLATTGYLSVLSLLSILLLLGPPQARAFFTTAERVPVGVLQVAVLNSFFGYQLAVEGTLFALAGPLSHRLVWYGLGLGGFGLVLVLLNIGLRRRSKVARVVTVLVYLAIAGLSLSVGSYLDLATAFLSLVPCALALVACIGLVAVPSSNEWFAGSTGVAPVSRLTLGALTLLAVFLIICVLIGLTSGTPSLPFNGFV